MTMQELEQDIIKDLQELGDPMTQYSFLLSCASMCPPFPGEQKTDENLIRECQVKTWISVGQNDGKVFFLMDSEALIVKGALSLLQEIYQDRSVEEVRAYQCTLPECKDFTRHFNAAQLVGVKAILNKLSQLS